MPKWSLSDVFEWGSMRFTCFLTFSQVLGSAPSRPDLKKKCHIDHGSTVDPPLWNPSDTVFIKGSKSGGSGDEISP